MGSKTISRLVKLEDSRRMNRVKISQRVQHKRYIQVKIHIGELFFLTLLWMGDCMKSCNIFLNIVKEKLSMGNHWRAEYFLRG